MSSISALIERYLKDMLAGSNTGHIEIQRNELAQKFSCVPSQINYVLSTRFSIEHGFIVESRRGGGGYVRIKKVPFSRELDVIQEICDFVGDAIAEQPACGIIDRLRNEGVLTNRESSIIKTVISRQVLMLGLPARDQLRANILKNVLITILKER
jgi:transcriptional regulator CtsR